MLEIQANLNAQREVERLQALYIKQEQKLAEDMQTLQNARAEELLVRVRELIAEAKDE